MGCVHSIEEQVTDEFVRCWFNNKSPLFDDYSDNQSLHACMHIANRREGIHTGTLISMHILLYLCQSSRRMTPIILSCCGLILHTTFLNLLACPIGQQSGCLRCPTGQQSGRITETPPPANSEAAGPVEVSRSLVE